MELVSHLGYVHEIYESRKLESNTPPQLSSIVTSTTPVHPKTLPEKNPLSEAGASGQWRHFGSFEVAPLAEARSNLRLRTYATHSAAVGYLVVRH